MSYGTPIAATLPVVSTTAGPTYAELVNAWCTEVETRLEGKVTTAGFTVDADLDYNTTYGAKNVQAVALAAATGTKTGTGNAGKLYRYNGELYYTNSSGTTVRLTNAGAIDIASVGGIDGDYTSDANASVDYTTATTLYRFLKNVTNSARAIVDLGTLRLSGTGNSPTYNVALAVPALSASYTMTLPAAVPASTSVLTMGTTGTIANSRDLSLASATFDSNGNITLAGTGYVKHGARTALVSWIHNGFLNAGTQTIVDTGTSGHYVQAGGATSEWYIDLPVQSNWHITSVGVRCYGGGASNMTLEFRKGTVTASSQVFQVTVSSPAGATLLAGTCDVTVSASESYFVRILAGQANDRFGVISIGYDVP